MPKIASFQLLHDHFHGAVCLRADLFDVFAHADAQAVAAPDAPARATIKQPVVLAGTAGLDAGPLLPAALHVTPPGQAGH